MNRFLTVLICVITAYSVTSNAQKRGPGEGGGGGNTITIDGKTELLDIYIFRKTRANFTMPPSQRGVTLPSDRALTELHITKLTNPKITNDLQNTNLLPVQIALQKIDTLWGSQPPVFIQSLKMALKSSPIYYMNYRFTRKEESYWIPEQLQNQIPYESIQLIAFYMKDMGMLVSKKDFEALDLFNQVAFVIHESIRQMQYTYGMEISNKDLQEVTANIAFGIPFLPEGVQNLMTKDDNEQAKAIRMYNKAQKDACALVSKLPYKNNFANAKEAICNAPLYDDQMTFNDPRTRNEILGEAINDAIVTAHNLMNQGKLTHDPIKKLMSMQTAAYTAAADWVLYSKELDQALNVMRGATMGLKGFSFDAVINLTKNGQTHPYASHLKSIMENWRSQGVLKD